MSDSFQIHYVPAFCGGRILTGFYHCGDKDFMEKNFDKLLKELINVISPSTPNGSLGVIYAITNSNQTGGAAFLARIGFKQVITTDKYGSMSTQNRAPTSPCITWIGNWFDDVQPSLNKELEEYKKRQVESVPASGLRSKFSSPTSSEDIHRARGNIGSRMRIRETRFDEERRVLYRAGYSFPVENVNLSGTHYTTNIIFNSVGNVFKRGSFGAPLQIRVEDCELVS